MLVTDHKYDKVQYLLKSQHFNIMLFTDVKCDKAQKFVKLQYFNIMILNDRKYDKALISQSPFVQEHPIYYYVFDETHLIVSKF